MEGLDEKCLYNDQVCLALRDNFAGMLLVPCCYSDGYGVRPTLSNLNYAHAMQVSSVVLNFFCYSEGRIAGAIVLNADVLATAK